jgi:hypothetical protein
MRKILQFTIAIAVVWMMLITIACPTQDKIKNAAKASYRLPGATVDLENAIKAGHEQGIISADLTRKFGDALLPASQAEQTLVVLVRAASKVYSQTGSVPAAQMSQITQLIDTIITAVSGVIQIFNLLPANAQALLNVALTAVRVLLQTIGGGFGSSLLHLIAQASNGPTSSIGNRRPQMRFA